MSVTHLPHHPVSNPDVPLKLPSLDGWRAISILMVLVSHSTITAGFPFAPDTALYYWCGVLGNWGVRFFFVISGFLITYLLLQEHANNGQINLRTFYLRRAVRILPVCITYLAVLQFFTPYSQPVSLWVANLTFTTNYVIISDPNATDHLWSLGVEEQFYFLWPFLLAFLLRRREGVATLTKMLLLPLVVAPAVRVLYHSRLYPHAFEFLFLESSFFAKCDSLAFGCLAAFSFSFFRSPLECFCNQRFLPGMLAVFLILSPVFMPLIKVFPRVLQTAGFESIQAIGFSVLLLQSVLHPSSGFYRCLNWKLVSQVGILSYSMYIWQQMFCTGNMVFGVKSAWWVSFPAWILVTLLAACGSYYLLEKPLLRLRAKLHSGYSHTSGFSARGK